MVNEVVKRAPGGVRAGPFNKIAEGVIDDFAGFSERVVLGLFRDGAADAAATGTDIAELSPCYV